MDAMQVGVGQMGAEGRTKYAPHERIGVRGVGWGGGLARFGLDSAHFRASWRPDSSESDPTLWESFDESSRGATGAELRAFRFFLIFDFFKSSVSGLLVAVFGIYAKFCGE